MLRPEGHRIREVARVSAAADGIRLGVLARHVVVGIDAHLHRRIIQSHVERLRVALYRYLRRVSRRALDGAGDLRPAHIGRVAAVYCLEHMAVLDAYNAAHDGQRLKQAVIRRNVQRGARPVVIQQAHQLVEALLLGGCNAVIQNVVHEHSDRVDGSLRQRCMAADTGGREVPKLALFHSLNAPGGFKRFGLDPRLGLVGHGVRREAALDVYNVHHRQLGDHAAVVNALFAVAQREVRVRTEAEQRSGVICQIILDVLHAGLFVCAEQRADRIAQGYSLVLEILQRVEAEDARPLVVHDAAADYVPLALAHGERILSPAFADRHHIEVSYRSEVAIAVSAEAGIADFALAVYRVEPQLAGDLKSLVKCLARAAAEGGVGLRLALDTVYRHKACYIAQYRTAV